MNDELKRQLGMNQGSMARKEAEYTLEPQLVNWDSISRQLTEGMSNIGHGLDRYIAKIDRCTPEPTCVCSPDADQWQKAAGHP